MFSDMNDIVNKSQIDNPNGAVFRPTKSWRLKFAKRHNLSWTAETKTEIDLFSLLVNLEPALEYVWLMRSIFGIPGGEGRILNADQTMFYRLYQSKYSYKSKK